ncbi:hypothetical protein N7466_011239 [Penicillium verhagenii]|uniref:uncharacterized protein n=1 Tax=Penicillium verhagenii TaxID=1562060 RepID=UPI0025451C35|nr:uncharacterized protein N7466_011239 [Penicillium verhagenii]KAJ5917685.1 hypothetical protein N7466_011239 [Penicillium verhagenii]
MTPNPAPSAIPNPNELQSSRRNEQDEQEDSNHRNVPQPKLRLHAQELRHPATKSFFLLIPDVSLALDTALRNIVKYLYTAGEWGPNDQRPKGGVRRTGPQFVPSIPPTRSVTLFLRDFGGVAYTTGSELDDDHKEIHFSLPYIQQCTSGPSAKADPLHELLGVLTHELVHCYQHTAPPQSQTVKGREIPRPPGGLIEGIADFVRLKAGLEPPHWKKPKSAAERAKNWDAGYQETAYFLAWIEDVWAEKGAVGRLNHRLLEVGYLGEGKDKEQGEDGFWKGLFGREVDDLWDEYGRWLDGDSGDEKKARGNWEDEILNPES